MEDTDKYEITGLIGGLIFPLCLIPQLTKTYKRKSADDLSNVWLIMTQIAIILHSVYAFAKELYPLYIPLVLEFIEISMLLCMKYNYKRLEIQNASPSSITPTI
tara:strand:- start:76 stop:387 length:312 start_codon:yes stop_codon:yes gene_type:complete